MAIRGFYAFEIESQRRYNTMRATAKPAKISSDETTRGLSGVRVLLTSRAPVTEENALLLRLTRVIELAERLSVLEQPLVS
jgi:hypothetical protein